MIAIRKIPKALCALQASLLLACLVAPLAIAQERVLDHVIAVVNNQVILASDLELELRFMTLMPIGDHSEATQSNALERLVTRALIEQQITQVDPHGLETAPRELEDSLADLRKNLPNCKHRDCVSEAGWRAYLTSLGLTNEQVDDYYGRRMAMLRFIEQRFRSSNSVPPEEIQKYYDENVVPKYANREEAPTLAHISQRIQEVLLQQQVNALLDDWLKSLQDQGQVEILDPGLRPPMPLPAIAPEKSGAEKPVPERTGPGIPQPVAPPAPTPTIDSQPVKPPSDTGNGIPKGGAL
jgi:peptidyl-prolyl cis-trans isomerase SurA